jgi:hypothetical protein
MIRRACWLGLGALLGVTGYRKAAAFAQALTPVRSTAGTGIRPGGGENGSAKGSARQPAQRPTRPAQSVRPEPRAAARLIHGARAAAAFTRDVRAGMRLYRRQQAARGKQLRPAGVGVRSGVDQAQAIRRREDGR